MAPYTLKYFFSAGEMLQALEPGLNESNFYIWFHIALVFKFLTIQNAPHSIIQNLLVLHLIIKPRPLSPSLCAHQFIFSLVMPLLSDTEEEYLSTGAIQISQEMNSGNFARQA